VEVNPGTEPPALPTTKERVIVLALFTSCRAEIILDEAEIPEIVFLAVAISCHMTSQASFRYQEAMLPRRLKSLSAGFSNSGDKHIFAPVIECSPFRHV
jgi:hypothetical protein